jgi:hypothetical protein
MRAQEVPSSSRAGRPRALILVMVAAALAHAAAAAVPDQMGDLLFYRQWTRELAERGVLASYWPAPAADPYLAPAIDYPPVYPYLLWSLGKLLAAAAPGVLASDRALDFGLRLLVSAADLVTAGLLFLALRRRAGDGVALLVTALFALNPAVIFDTAYWGQSDSLCAALVVGALVLRDHDHARRWPAWVALTLAGLVKPLAWPLLPLLAAAEWRERGARAALAGLATGGATVAVVLLPFVVAGRLAAILRMLVTQVDAMPYASVNAHNLWWLLTRGLPWTPGQARFLGPLSVEAMGLALFGAFYAVTLALVARRGEPRTLERGAAGVAFGAFILATRMHENHLFLFLPLLLLADGEKPWARRLFVLVSITLCANMALHDPLLNALARPLAPGPRVLLPPQESVDPALLDALRTHGYPLRATQMRGEASVFWAGLTLLNSQANVLLFAAWVAWAAGRWPRRWRAMGVGVLLFLLATGLPFLARVLAARPT